MTRPDPHADDPALQEVQDAYRNLPPIQPDAALDARVRAAVAAEVLAGAPSRPEARVTVIPFRRWRRAAVPLTAAAAVLVAIGVSRLQPPAPVLAPAGAPHLAAKREQSVAPQAAPEAMMLAAPPALEPASPPPASRLVPSVSTTPLNLPLVTGPAPPQANLQANDSADYSIGEQRLRGIAQGVVAQDKVSASPAAAAAPSRASGTPAASSAASSEDTAVFEEIRRLLAEHRRDDARVRLKRWREAHLEAPLPADLEPLAAEPAR
jgi:negative regulator of sigma E activity